MRQYRMVESRVPRSQIEEIAARLLAAREALGIGPAELCRRTGISPNTYSQWESAKGRPSLDEAMKLCRVLGYTLDWIYLGNPSGLPDRIASSLPAIAAS